MASVTVTCDNGRPVQELARLIEQRAKWLKQTAEESCTACMMDVLVSLRALAKEARPKKAEIKLKATTLRVGWRRDGGRNHPVLKTSGYAEYTLQQGESIIWATRDASQYNLCRIWRWNDYKDRTWLIVAPNQAMAKERALKKV